MTHCRQIMLEELQRRNCAPTTVAPHLHAVEQFARHFKCRPDRLNQTPRAEAATAARPPAADTDPAWAPDERRVAFTSNRAGTAAVYVKDLIAGTEERLVVRDDFLAVDEWTPDDKVIISRDAGRAVWSVALSGDRTPKMLVDTPYVEDEVHAHRWLGTARSVCNDSWTSAIWH